MEHVRILMLEDSSDDVTLIQREIDKGGVLASYQVTDSQTGFEDHLITFRPDIVLSDHSLPAFNSIDALRIVRDKASVLGYRTPIILVTGSVSEEFAAACMRNGADDYILKDHMTRLPEAIRNAILKAQAERNQTRYFHELLLREAQTKEAEQLAHLGTCRIALSTQECIWSDEFFRIFGYTPGQVVPSLPLLISHIHPVDRKRVSAQFDFAIKTGESITEEFRIIDDQGETKYVYVKMALPIQDEKPDHLICFVRDITARRTVEKLLNEAYQISRIGAWKLNLATGKLIWTKVTKELYEVSPDFEPDVERAIEFYPEGESRQRMKAVFEKAIAEGEPWDVEVQIKTFKGNIKWIRSKGEVEMLSGRATRLYGSIQDIHNVKLNRLQLEHQYEQLRAIAWSQSHEVRAPLARIIGFANLMSSKLDANDLEDLFVKLRESSAELDQIVRQIVRKSEEMGI